MRVGGLIVLGREEVKHSSVMPGVDLFVEPEIPNVSVDQLQSIRGSDSFLDPVESHLRYIDGDQPMPVAQQLVYQA